MDVTIYSTKNCSVCKSAKKYMQEQGIEYDEIFVDENERAFDEMLEATGKPSVPQFEVNGKWTVGFNKKMFEYNEEDWLTGSGSSEYSACESCE